MYDTLAYCQAVSKLREFFYNEKGFIEVPAQSRLSILAACEDPKTITKFNFNKDYPLPQTGQMWLEYELLKNPSLPGVFCITTSYRNEPNPIPGRHDKIFPMFEFEAKGGINELRKLEGELLEFIGFDAPTLLEYTEAARRYHARELNAEHELAMQKDISNVISLEHFPEHTSPFWNMKYSHADLYSKIDVILYGMETIGSAERETDVELMREKFHTISDGEYANILFKAFSKERVLQELEEYLELPMIERFGGGIGMTRMARAMKLAGLLEENSHFMEERICA